MRPSADLAKQVASFKLTPVFGNKQNIKADFIWPSLDDLTQAGIVTAE